MDQVFDIYLLTYELRLLAPHFEFKSWLWKLFLDEALPVNVAYLALLTRVEYKSCVKKRGRKPKEGSSVVENFMSRPRV